MSNFIRVFESIQKTGGASFCLHTGELNPPTGYMVSEEGNEMKFAIPKTLNKFQDIVIQYMLKKSKAFVFESPDEYLGFWIDNNQLYIDISRRFENKQSAIGYGRINNQIAIFDNANKQSIFPQNPR